MLSTGMYKNSNGVIAFRIFAPYTHSLSVQCTDTGKNYKLSKGDSGWFEGILPDFSEGTRYLLIKNENDYFPDPSSHYQPEGPHAPSQVAFPIKVKDSSWRGISISDAIIYELHLGTFSPEGNLKGALKRIPYLKDLGINVIELMPLAEFPGERNWGYDGTYLFALSRNYGTYQDLHDFIKEAHQNGIAVILDVVFNHFGPEGNYSEKLAPFTKKAATPWGAQINFDGKNSSGIRNYFLECTRYWLEDAGLDGFRMDAISVIFDDSIPNILKEITDLAKSIGKVENRTIMMIAEHLRNEGFVTDENYLGYDSQWCDDLNYAVYSWLYPQNFRHYRDFGKFEDIELSLKEGFCYNGTRYNSVFNNYMGESGKTISPVQIVMHIQNHDQVGNRPDGSRIISVMGQKRALLAAMTLFVSPYVPMLFMGEEYGEKSPFLFFEDFGDSRLIKAVQRGRKNEFSFVAGYEPESPHEKNTFLKSKLQWLPENEDPAISEPSQEILFFYKQLIKLKKNGIIGSHNRKQCLISSFPDTGVITITSSYTITVLNFGARNVNGRDYGVNNNNSIILSTIPNRTGMTDKLFVPGFSGSIFKK